MRAPVQEPSQYRSALCRALLMAVTVAGEGTLMELIRTVTLLARWLEEYGPGDYRQLAPPAGHEAIDAVTEGKFPLHPDVRAWLALHDGSAYERLSPAGAFVPLDYAMLDTARMRQGLRDMEEEVARAMSEGDEEYVVGTMADVCWVPVAANHTGGLLVVDHRDGSGHGAVLEVDPSIGLEGVRRWDSLSHLFDSVLDALVHSRALLSGSGAPAVPRVHATGPAGPHVVWELHYG